MDPFAGTNAMSLEPLPTPCVLYGAKSTEDPRGSIGTQLQDCRDAISREADRPGQPEKKIVGEYSDEGKSAYKGNRGEGLAVAKERAAEAAAEHGAAELWVQHSDRIARGDGLNADHLAEVYFAMRRAGVRLRSVQDDSNLDDAIRAVLIGERNTEDSRRKSDAVRAGKRRQFERGERLGGPVPDGYLRILNSLSDGQICSEYHLDPARAPILRRAFQLSAEGIGDPSIARTLNAEGFRRKSGKPWDRRSVEDKITNPFYAGRVVRDRGSENQETREGSHPALVPAEVFDQIQAAKGSRDRAKGSARNKGGRPTTYYALSRLARCERCEGRMLGVTSSYTRKDGSKRRTYVCENVKGCTGVCDQPPMDAQAIDRDTIAHLDGFFLDFDGWLQTVTKQQASERESIRGSITAHERSLEKCRLRETKLRERYLAAIEIDDPGEVEREALQAITTERDQVIERLTSLREALVEASQEDPADALLDFWNDLSLAVRGRVNCGSMAEVNAGLRETFDRFVLNVEADGIRVSPYLREITGFIIEHPYCDRGVLMPMSALEADKLDLDEAVSGRHFRTLITDTTEMTPTVERLSVPAGNPRNAQL